MSVGAYLQLEHNVQRIVCLNHVMYVHHIRLRVRRHKARIRHSVFCADKQIPFFLCKKNQTYVVQLAKNIYFSHELY